MLKSRDFHKPFSFDVFLQNSYQPKRASNRDINDDDIDNDRDTRMIAIEQFFTIRWTPITDTAFLSEECRIS